ncbi:hypothetical protein [Mycobacterium uberis]|uniref:hypothetical protein n=1 Tax=Mycobacterium uberis TaxID=2162698 RepID=UPI000E309AE6|nr:hypothetical protein [Mycobacterium uberis]
MDIGTNGQPDSRLVSKCLPASVLTTGTDIPGNAMHETHPASTDTPQSTTTQVVGAGGGHYPDNQDAGLLQISDICVLPSDMVMLSISVAQRALL